MAYGTKPDLDRGRDFSIHVDRIPSGLVLRTTLFRSYSIQLVKSQRQKYQRVLTLITVELTFEGQKSNFSTGDCRAEAYIFRHFHGHIGL